jgi:two-component system LytT family response regulator
MSTHSMPGATSTAIRTIIVDDEELARRGIEIRLQPHTDFAVVSQCGNGREALQAIAREQPDLMFLDIQMPGMSGFDVLACLPQESMPIVVFVTAYDRFALDAFEAQALDYLLKPISDMRFPAVVERVRNAWKQRAALNQHDKLMRLLATTTGDSAIDLNVLRNNFSQSSMPCYIQVLPIRTEVDTIRLAVSTIDWIDAAGDYMCIHSQERTYVVRETMKSLESLLDPAIFQRVHRSTIVNLQRVQRMRPHNNGEYFLTLTNGQEVKLSRSYRDSVDRLLRRQ